MVLLPLKISGIRVQVAEDPDPSERFAHSKPGDRLLVALPPSCAWCRSSVLARVRRFTSNWPCCHKLTITRESAP
jgi:hypothetical protein